MDVIGKAHPIYNLLPWEVKHANRLGNEATEYVEKKYGYVWTEAQRQRKQQNAITGAKGEIAFMQMLKDEHQEVIDWTADGKDYAEYYDFELANSRLGKVDIKAAFKTPKTSQPTSINFIFGGAVIHMYADGTKKVPDHFALFWVDDDKVVFAGAITKFLFEQYINGDRPWDYQLSGGLSFINRKSFDANDIFLSYFKDSNKIDYTGPIF